MTESMATTGARSAAGHAGEDFVCRACGCEVVVKHWGEPTSHADAGAFVCHCGQEMEPEHAGSGTQGRQAVTGGDRGQGFSQDDFLGEGGGAPEVTTGVGRAGSWETSPGGGR